MKKMLMVILIAMVSSYGCATLVTGTSQKISVSSSPDNAMISIDNVFVGNSPISVDVNKDTGKYLLVEKEGYYPKKMLLTTKMSNWFWGNIVGLLFFDLSSGTDALTKGMLEYSPDQYYITLDPINTLTSGMDIYEARREVKLFIVSNHSDIIKELNAGRGEYVKTLLRILKIADENSDAAIMKIKGLSQAYSEAPDFSERVVELFLGKEST
ncbi:MAG: PEGA domain-containing protein [Thermodesulfobacteriota bacterium]